jgi:hypothetical protein
VDVAVESGGVALRVEIAPEGEEPTWKEGPAGRIVATYDPGVGGRHTLTVRGSSMTYGNAYELVVRNRAR